MKRFASIAGLLLLFIISSLWIIYVVREQKADNQHVSSASTSILSIAVDDLLLEHISSILPKSRKNEPSETSKFWVKEILFNAGINVPARIQLFTMPAQEARLYGILALSNYDNCFSFFANRFPEDIRFVDKEKGLISVAIDKHVNVLFDRNAIVYKLSLEADSNFDDLQSILSAPESWRKIGSFKEFEYAKSNKHVAYVLKDGSLKMAASVFKNNTEITGEWLLSQDMQADFKIRDMDTTKQSLTFWTALPFSEVPQLTTLLRKFIELEPTLANSSSYLDLQIKSDTVLQQDTSIVYAYDADFNVVEELQINEVVVPNISLALGYNDVLADKFPNTLFYKFQKKRVGEYLLNTTSTSSSQKGNSKKTKQPLYLYIDFERWPEDWEASIFRKLKEAKVRARILTERQSKKKLLIKGEVSY